VYQHDCGLRHVGPLSRVIRPFRTSLGCGQDLDHQLTPRGGAVDGWRRHDRPVRRLLAWLLIWVVKGRGWLAPSVCDYLVIIAGAAVS
jgi:hypothetical protein